MDTVMRTPLSRREKSSHSHKGFLRAVIMPVVLLSSNACRQPVAPRTTASGVAEAPPGTIEVDSVSLAAAGGSAVASIRDAETGKFGVWTLDLRTATWEKVTERLFTYPLAVVPGDDSVLVVDPAPEGAVARVIQDGFDSTYLMAPLPRGGYFDSPTKSWWIGGIFQQGARQYLAVQLAADGSVSYHVEAPTVPWLGVSRSEFTGLTLDDAHYYVTTPASCDLLHINRETNLIDRRCSIATADPRMRLACKCSLATGASRDEVTEASEEYDWPLKIWNLGDQIAVLVRLSARRGWEVCTFDAECVPGPNVILPYSQMPLALSRQHALILRGDLDEPGKPAHLEILDLPQFLARGSDATMPSERMSARVFTVRDVDEWPADTSDPIIIVDGRLCIGDAIQDLCHAQSVDELGITPYQLVVTGAANTERAEMIARSIVRYVPLTSTVFRWLTAVPVETKSLGRAVRLAGRPSR